MSIKKMVPWPLKILIKSAVGATGMPHGIRKRIGFFEHGDADKILHAMQVMGRFYDMAAGVGLKEPKSVLELGPGEGPWTPLLAAAKGAKAATMVDVGYYIDTAVWEKISKSSFVQGVEVAYLHQGLQSLKGLPEGSRDLIYSYAVLEHVRREELAELIQETHRILAPGGVSVHYIDYSDHFSGSKRQYNYSLEAWEKPFLRNTGYYTNRIGHSAIMKMATDAGFDVVSQEFSYVTPAPGPVKVHPDYEQSQQDYDIYGSWVVMKKRS